MNEVVLLGGHRHVVWQCGTCGVFSTCPEIVYEQHRMEGGYHHCPNGHTWGWSKENCEREKLRRERDRLKQREAQLLDENKAAADRAIKAEGAERRLKKRMAAGTCPCCQRTFSNMAQHMKRQHPEFVKKTGANVVPLQKAK